MFTFVNKLKFFFKKLLSRFSKKNKKDQNQDDIYPLW